jgi:hypothetical protein
MDIWIAPLKFAALPGAAMVSFSRTFTTEDGTATTNYHLESRRSDGTKIGDDRDYDLLKAAIGPLEKLAETHFEGDVRVVLDISANKVTVST